MGREDHGVVFLAGEIQQAGVSRLTFGFREGEMGRFRADAARAERDARGQGALETRLRFGQRVGVAVACADVAAHDGQGKPGERLADVAERLAGHVLLGGGGKRLGKGQLRGFKPGFADGRGERPGFHTAEIVAAHADNHGGFLLLDVIRSVYARRWKKERGNVRLPFRLLCRIINENDR